MLSCTLLTGPASGPLTMSLVSGTSDTVSPQPSFIFSFSSPLRSDDTLVRFQVNPSEYEFSTQLNKTRDTVTLTFASLLQGSSRYVIYLADTLVPEKGATLLPGQDSTVFYTYPLENEPNNTEATSDTVTSTIFGLFNTIEDTDWYCLPRTVKKIILSNAGVKAQCDILDSSGTVFHVNTMTGIAETLAVPDTFSYPLHARLYPWNQSRGGLCQLTLVK